MKPFVVEPPCDACEREAWRSLKKGLIRYCCDKIGDLWVKKCYHGRPKTDHVYVIGPVDGCYKIGYSKNPERRLKQLCKAKHNSTVVCKFPSLHASWIENYLHQAFFHRWSHGEWFRLTTDDIAIIKTIHTTDIAEDLPDSIHRLWSSHGGVSIRGRNNPIRPNMTPLAARLRSYRVYRNWTQQGLAQDIGFGFTAATICAFENCRVPMTQAVIDRVSDYLAEKGA